MFRVIGGLSTDRYLLLDGSEGSGRTAQLLGPLLEPDSYCLRLKYHMDGSQMGTLRIIIRLQSKSIIAIQIEVAKFEKNCQYLLFYYFWPKLLLERL